MGNWVYPLYVLDLAAMVFLSYVLGDLVDMLDKKTKISGAFIGGVLLAAVTSLPELFTAISSIFLVAEPTYVVGDLLGSIVFDMVCLAIETAIFIKHFHESKIQNWHIINALACLFMYGFAAYAFFAPKEMQVMLGDINLMSIFIFVLYVLTIVFQPKEAESDVKEEVKWSLSKIIITFIISSILLIGSSIALTYLTKGIQEKIPALSGSVAGALLLGIGTSIPEIISTAQLFHKKNYDAGYGNMIGSCTFDFSIFALADFLTWHQYYTNTPYFPSDIYSQLQERGLYIVDADSTQFEIYGLIIAALLILFMLLKNKTKLFDKKGVSYTSTFVFATACSALYLIIFII